MKHPASTARSELAPEVEPEFEGIAIALAPRPRADAPLVVHGTFRVPWRAADAIAPPRQRALVLVVTSVARDVVLTPFAEQVLFEDDETATPRGAFGHFSLDVGALLAAHAPERAPGAGAPSLHVFVSIGPVVSNVVQAVVG